MNIRSRNNPQYNRKNINTSDTVMSHSKDRPLNSSSSQVTDSQRGIGNSEINIPSHEFLVEQILSLDSCNEQGAAYSGTTISSQESIQRAAYKGIERSSQESLQRAVYPGIERLSQESLPLSLSPTLFPSLENITKATNIDVPTKGETITVSNVENRIQEHNLHVTSNNRTDDNLIEIISEKKINIFQNGKEMPFAPNNCSYLRGKQPYGKENNVGVSLPTINIGKVVNPCFIPPITEMDISDDDVKYQRRNFTDAINKKKADVPRKKKLNTDLYDQRLRENNMCSITKKLLEHKQIRLEIILCIFILVE